MLQIYYLVTLMMCFWGAFECDKHGSDILGRRENQRVSLQEFTLIFSIFFSSAAQSGLIMILVSLKLASFNLNPNKKNGFHFSKKLQSCIVSTITLAVVIIHLFSDFLR